MKHRIENFMEALDAFHSSPIKNTPELPDYHLNSIEEPLGVSIQRLRGAVLHCPVQIVENSNQVSRHRFPTILNQVQALLLSPFSEILKFRIQIKVLVFGGLNEVLR